MSIDRINEKLKMTQPYVTYLRGYVNVATKCTFLDSEYGEFEGEPYQVVRKKRVHPDRSNKSKNFKSLNNRLEKAQPHLKYISGYENNKSICTFLDSEYGEFEGQWTSVRCGSKVHPKRVLNPCLVNYENINNSIEKAQPHLKYISGYENNKSICTFLDSEYGEFEGQWDSVRMGSKVHPKKSQYEYHKDVQNIKNRLKKIRTDITYIRGYKTCKSICTFLDSEYGEFEAVWDSVIHDGTKHPTRRNNNTKPEQQLQKIIESFKLVYTKESYISKYRVDFYIKSLYQIIEVDGIYWHSNNSLKCKSYHTNKYKFLTSVGYKLLAFYDCEVEKKPFAVASIIEGSLNQNPESFIFKSVEYVNKKKIKKFLEKYSLEDLNYSGYTIKTQNNEVVAYLKIKQNKNTILIKEFCASFGFYNVKTLQIFLKELKKQNKEIIWISSNRLNTQYIFNQLILSANIYRTDILYTDNKTISKYKRVKDKDKIYGYGRTALNLSL